MHHNCPYCNAEVVLTDIACPWFETSCCKKIVSCSDWSEPAFAMHRADDSFMQEHGIIGNNLGDVSIHKMGERKTKPRLAHVYSNAPHWFVRIIPPCDLSEHGRGHGVALGNKYTTKAEANVFADSMENYFGDAEQDIKVTAQTDVL